MGTLHFIWGGGIEPMGDKTFSCKDILTILMISCGESGHATQILHDISVMIYCYYKQTEDSFKDQSPNKRQNTQHTGKPGGFP